MMRLLLSQMIDDMSGWIAATQGSPNLDCMSRVPRLGVPVILRGKWGQRVARRLPLRRLIFDHWYRGGPESAREQVVSFARRVKPDRVWVVATGVGIPLGNLVAQETGLPVHVSVHDHHAGHIEDLEALALDPPMRGLLGAASSADFVSHSLADQYQPYLGRTARVSVALTGGDPEWSRASVVPAPAVATQLIFFGNPWARDALGTLDLALDHLRVYRNVPPPEIKAFGPSRSEWRNVKSRPAVAIRELSAEIAASHGGYVPMSFLQSKRRLTETSFPSKALHLFQLGVPVFFHAPPYAACVKFANDYGAGFVSNAEDSRTLADDLARFCQDWALRERLATRGKELYEEMFSPSVVAARIRGLMAL